MTFMVWATTIRIISQPTAGEKIDGHGYHHQSKLFPVLWKHDTHPIQFTSGVVDDFGVKYWGRTSTTPQVVLENIIKSQPIGQERVTLEDMLLKH